MIKEDAYYSGILKSHSQKTFWYWSKDNSLLLSLTFFIQFLLTYFIFFLIFFWQDVFFLFTDFFVKILLLIGTLTVAILFFLKNKLVGHLKKILIWLCIFQMFFIFLAFASPVYIVSKEDILIHSISFIVKSKTAAYTIREFVTQRVLGSSYIYTKGRQSSSYDEKINYYKKAIMLNADYYNPYASLAFEYLREKDCNKAIQTIERVIKKIEKPDNPYIEGNGKAYFFSAFAYILQTCTANDNRIEHYYNASLELDDSMIETYVNRAQYYLLVNELDNAEDDLIKCSSDVVEDIVQSSCMTNLGVLFEKRGDVMQAKKYAQLAVELNDNNADAWNNYGYYLAVEGNITEAIKSFQKALEINPNLQIAQENLSIYSL
ncbi:hypothetical protein A3A93_04870 [Candidatus Roizmanbacteria bacterium RIFCSPLOWO2_01_FULL_38_12]|uniref:Uncharacterized protein n=1 Tax=Candidatus Roizmanbacteria bacterium RIFCSPLOWO2_01_FULL_38_12 TaxID=1802061 RepID=A0A1F7IW10_9BACT|nr:MAG: hypothetical protein A3F59_06120 [Candidatus Roizmanbacteria bacterium RIFCSPHIGHO2_12_FULL_38_13]OGK47541.1 MAG: hypothetical protein A3A93_04870 [Candidatus Roizmanbacteria bacterium RIFCSPLOWO2_01_FULL_38_12]